MTVDGKTIKQIQNALLNAFSTDELARLVRIELDQSLDSISTAQNQTQVVFDLIEWADRQGRLNDLITSAKEYNPDNPALKALELVDAAAIEAELSQAEPAKPALGAGVQSVPAEPQNAPEPSRGSLTWVYGLVALALLAGLAWWFVSNIGGPDGDPATSSPAAKTEVPTVPAEPDAPNDTDTVTTTGEVTTTDVEPKATVDLAACAASGPALSPEFTGIDAPTNIGCPRNEDMLIWGAIQEFEGGYLVWLSDPDGENVEDQEDKVYAFYGLTSGPWVELPESDKWDNVTPMKSRGEPPEGFFAPVDGFGFVWGESQDIYENLMWASDEQKGFCAFVQDFEQGFILRSTDKGCDGKKGDVTGLSWHPITIVANANREFYIAASGE